MNKKLFDAIEEKKVLIAAHRGALGGNIIDNTFLSAENCFSYGSRYNRDGCNYINRWNIICFS